MPDPQNRPSTEAADERRRAIVEAAARLFDAEGYNGTSMTDIANAANLRKPTLYHYFTSKTDILFAIHDNLIDYFLDNQRRREQQSGLSPAQELLEVMGDLLTMVQRQPGYFRVFFENGRQLPEHEQTIVAAKRNEFRTRVQNILERGIESGDFRQMDVGLISLQILGMCNFAYQWLRDSGPLDGRQVALTFWDGIVNGIAPSTTPSS